MKSIRWLRPPVIDGINDDMTRLQKLKLREKEKCIVDLSSFLNVLISSLAARRPWLLNLISYLSHSGLFSS